MTISRKGHEGRGLERCPCGKAIYASFNKAYRAKDRYRLGGVYRCPDFGKIHVTSKRQNDAAGQVDRRPHHRRKAVPAMLTCPVCSETAQESDGSDLRDELASCAHPLHWADRDPGRPYYPDVTVEITGHDSNVFMSKSLVSKALRRAGADGPTMDAFGKDFTGSADYPAALDCLQRWVYVS